MEADAVLFTCKAFGSPQRLSARLGSLETVKYNTVSSLERYQDDTNQTQDGLFNVVLCLQMSDSVSSSHPAYAVVTERFSSIMIS